MTRESNGMNANRHLPIKTMLVVAVAAASLVGCQETPMPVEKGNELHDAIASLRGVRIFFGHQSVGGNVLDGLAAFEQFGLPLVDIRETNDLPGGSALLHTYVGRNVHPDEKVEDFATILRSELGASVDVAFLKFCYVDIDGPSWDGEKVFNLYMDEMRKLEDELPDTTLAYLTMPLMTPGRSLKDVAKRILGRPTSRREGNIERNRFNELLREAKGDSGRLFDIAAIEATRPDGIRETIRIEGEAYDVMYRGYTSDGGHLNDVGKALVARELILFLSELAGE